MSGSLTSVAVAFVAVFCAAVYRYIMHPAFLSPLSKIPAAHATAHISSAWISLQRYRHTELRSLFEAHQKYGPVVRIGPSDLSINCVKGGLQTVYSGGFEKPSWYMNVFANFGTLNMVSFMDHRSHSIRKRMISNIYSKSTLLTSPALNGVTHEVIFNRLLPLLHCSSEGSRELDIYSLFGGVAMDIVTGYLFSVNIGSNFTCNEKERKHFQEVYFSRRGPDFWLQTPELNKTLGFIGIKLIPDWFDAASAEVENFVMDMCKKAGAVLSQSSVASDIPLQSYPTVYAHLSAALGDDTTSTKQVADACHLDLASELMDHTIAGFETSSITLTYIAWELSQRPALQSALRAELLTLHPPVSLPRTSVSNPVGGATAANPDSSLPGLPNPKVLDALPLLHAVVYETLRLHPGAPGPQPRLTPHTPGGTILGPPGTRHCYAGIPGGVRVAANPYCIHRNDDVFPESELWVPERWLDAQGRVLRLGMGADPWKADVNDDPPCSAEEQSRAREMGRWFWAFGSGGRVCIGNHLAIHQIKHTVAALYTNFTTEIADDEGIEQEDSFLAHPKGHKLVVKLKKVIK